ncbi:glycosyltransferase [candidate division KSB1 bacterium]|nr:glycosyltransferase [candidate division KSB1 bacterium]
MPKCTIIITTYNRQQFICDAVNSVLSQTNQNFELIVVDDGSTDNTRAIVNDFDDKVQYVFQENQGISAARNCGIRLAQGEFIAFLDSDDIWQPHKLQLQMDYFAMHPESQICYTNEIWMRNDRRVNPGKVHQKYGGHIFQHCLKKCFISASTVIIHKQVFDDVGLFDEQLTVCEDYDMWLRISAKYVVDYIDTPLIVKRDGHDDQLSHRFWGMDRFRVTAIAHLLEATGLNEDDRLAAFNVLERKCTILANGFKKRGKEENAHFYSMLLQKYNGTP